MHQGCILHVDDDANDRFFFDYAWSQVDLHLPVVALSSGEEALAYLSGVGQYEDRSRFPAPCMIFLDLKMNGTSGLDVLAWIRAKAHLHSVVVIVLSSSNLPNDVERSLSLGANAYITKPSSRDVWLKFARSASEFWLNFHEFPWNSRCRTAESLALA